MENKLYLKRYIVISAILAVLFTMIAFLLNWTLYEKYKANYNNKLGSIIEKVCEEYPLVSKEDIVDILNSQVDAGRALSKYGYDLESDDLIMENEALKNKSNILLIAFMAMYGISLVIVFIYYNGKKDREIRKIVKCIENINQKNYELDLDEITEDELSILRSEVYKTTIMLKEDADNSKKSKVALKDTLSDISHQLKTPLTSILIMIDDILDDKEMNSKTRDEFLNDIRREILNINFLVHSILKLSRFDADAIVFVEKNVSMKELLESAKKNISSISDLLDVEVNIDVKNDRMMPMDAKWQIEAITNVLKNAVEYSDRKGSVDCIGEECGLYYQITITDHGKGMSKEDIKHIFDRFYKGQNSTSDSIGIGLSLAKAIIEKGNGTIMVDSKLGSYTKFTIRYFYK